jgi:hypothetical protein
MKLGGQWFHWRFIFYIKGDKYEIFNSWHSTPFPAAMGGCKFCRTFVACHGASLLAYKASHHGGAISCRRWYRRLCQTPVSNFFKTDRQTTHH